ncbi:hypothetical protein WB334_26070, partial [Escherichia coli]|uniref:hypothetical protein n=1 Tax=Escherichia coli TaxID=562 RepID=UPI00215880AD
MNDTARPIRLAPGHPNYRLPDPEDLVPDAKLYTVMILDTDDGSLPYPDKPIRLDEIPIVDWGGEMDSVLFRYLNPHYIGVGHDVPGVAPITDFVGNPDPKEPGQD